MLCYRATAFFGCSFDGCRKQIPKIYQTSEGYYTWDFALADSTQSGRWELSGLSAVDNNSNRTTYVPISSDLSAADFEVLTPEMYANQIDAEYVLENTNWNYKTINSDVYVGPDAILTINGDVTINGDIYILGAVVSYGDLKADKIYAASSYFGFSTNIYQGSFNVRGGNYFVNSIIASSKPIPDLPFEISSSNIVTSNRTLTLLEGSILPICDLYIDENLVSYNSNGTFSLKDFYVGSKQCLEIKMIDVFGDEHKYTYDLINPNNKLLTYIDVSSLPNKLSYVVGQQIDLDGLSVTGYYDDGSIEPIPTDMIQISGFDSSIPGSGQMVTLDINGLTSTFEVDIINARPITEISIDSTDVTLNVGSTKKLNATINPSDTTDDETITWSSADQSVVTVDSNGTVKAIGAGSTTITATTSNGKSATCEVSVINHSGVYSIRSKKSGLVMDVYGGGGDAGNRIIQWDYHGGINQQWLFESLNNGYYKISSVANPQYFLDVYGGGTATGVNVIQWGYHGGINQQWKVIENDDGSISLMSRLAEESGTGYLLDVYGGGTTSGVNVIQWEATGGDNQKWYLDDIESSANTVTFESNGGSSLSSTSYSNGSLIIEPTAPVKSGASFDGWFKDTTHTEPWDFETDTMPNHNITLYAYWTIDYSGTYTIKSKKSGLVMDVYGGGDYAGNRIIQWEKTGGTNQQWQFESLGNGYYKISSVANPQYSLMYMEEEQQLV